MKNKLKAQIAAAYFGAKVVAEDIYNKKEKFDIVGIDTSVMHKIKLRGDWLGGTYCISQSGWHDLTKCQLLLTPLAKISNEDAIEVAKIANISYNIRKELWSFDYSNNITIGRDIVHTIDFDLADRTCMDSKNQIEIIDYLRSKSYDCGYGSDKSGIEAGWAIDETEPLKTN